MTLATPDDEFEIAVADTGRGMTPEFLAHAFDRFRQADSSTTRSHGGLGIGLAIARHLAELHGGTIAAESAGHGPRFAGSPSDSRPSRSASSPCSRRATERAPAARQPERLTSVLTGVRVLLVEDQWDSRELMAEILRRAGAEVTAAGSAAEAMEAIASARPDVLVSDIGMPGEDGYALLRRIRTSAPERLASIPALAVSAYAREEDRIRSLAAGFQVHLAKPFEPVELVAAVDRVVHRGPTAAAAPGPAAEAATAAVLVVEDDDDSREGLRLLLEEWGHSVEVAENGFQAIERCFQARPRVALIDIGLPDVSGYEVARRIRSQLDATEIYLVAVTGHATSADLQIALESGFDTHMTKPVSFEKLRALLETRLAKTNG